MVVVNGYLYGSGDSNREWRCVDWKTGTEKYADNTIGKGVRFMPTECFTVTATKANWHWWKQIPQGLNWLAKPK